MTNYITQYRRTRTPNYIPGVRPLSPPYMTNLLGWYKADAGVLKTGPAAAGDGDTIATVSDQSGNGYDLSATGTPIYLLDAYNSLPGMYFDGSSYLSNASILGAGNWGGAVGTEIIVYQSFATNYWAARIGSAGDGNWRFGGDGNGYFAEFRNARINGYPAGMPWLTHTLLTCVSGATNYFVRVNRSQAANQATSWGLNGTMYLGGGGSSHLVGFVFEYMLFNAELTAAQIEQNETYLGSKWGI